jgi:hypothetical protein
MALTADQKASYLFKQSLGVAETNVLRDFFEENIKGRILVLNNQIWVQSDQIPANAPTLADGARLGVVQYYQERTMTAVAGVSNSFYLEDLKDSIPFNFGNGSYNYVITSSTGTAIPFGQGDWLVNNATGTLTFYGSVPSNMPPKISFYKYVGAKGAAGEGSLPEIYTVQTAGERDEIIAKQGDLCVVIEESSTYGYSSSGWVLLESSGSAPVLSVNSLTGVVVLQSGNITESTNLYFTDERAKTAAVIDDTSGSQTDVAPSVASIKAYIAAQGAPVTSVNTYTGAVVLQSGDIAESANLYFTDERAKTAAVIDDTSGSQTDVAPSVASIKAYIAAQGAPVLSVNGETGAVEIPTLDHPTTGSTFEFGVNNPSMTGGSNTVIGVDSGLSLTSGYGNTLFGNDTGTNLTVGTNNVAIGKRALKAFNEGSFNTHIYSTENEPPSFSLVYSGTVAIGADNFGNIPQEPTNNNQFILGTDNHKYILNGDVQSPLKLGPRGELAGDTNELRFLELSVNGNNYAGFKAADSITNSIVWTLPAADGTANQVLKTDGSGQLGWVSTDAAGSITHPTTGSTYEFDANSASLSGQHNTAFGVSAGGAVTTGGQNSLYGSDAGSALTSGIRNTYFGYQSGLASVLVSNNTAFGASTLSGLTTGSFNIAIGDGAGSGLTNGSYNTFINSVQNAINTDGVVVIGRDSTGNSTAPTASNEFILGTSNHKYKLPGTIESVLQVGPYSTASGSTGTLRLKELSANGSQYVAFRAPDSISSNVTWTLPSTDGSVGQVITTNGSGVLSWSTPASVGSISHPTTGSTFEYNTNNPSMTGENNTAIGVNAGAAIVSASYNTFFGSGTGRYTTSHSNTAVGYGALGNNTTGSSNTAMGWAALSAATSASATVAIGIAAGNALLTGSYNTFINTHGGTGASGEYSLSGLVVIGKDSSGAWAYASQNNDFVLGTTNHNYITRGLFKTDIRLGPRGTDTGEGGKISFYELAANGVNSVSFKAADAIASDIVWTLPAADGTNGQVLTTNGSGTLIWADAGGGSSGGSIEHPTTGSTFEGGGFNVAMTGVDNTSLGVASGVSITNGYNNTIFGKTAGSNLNSGHNNVLIGRAAGFGLTTANNCVVIGSNSVVDNNNSSYYGFVVIGSDTCRYQTPATNSVVVGYNSVSNGRPGTYTTIIGSGSGTNTTSNYSTIIGGFSGRSLYNGSHNIFIGYGSGSNLQTGSYNTIIGTQTSQTSNVTGCVAIGQDYLGNGAYASASSDFVLGVSTHNYKLPGTVITDLVLGPKATASGSGGQIQFRELAVNGTNYVAFRAADSITNSVTWTLPSTDGGGGQVLTTDGSGTLSWATIAGSGTFPPVAAGDFDFLNSSYRRLYPKINNIGSTSGTVNIDLSVSNYHRLTVTGNTTLNFQNVSTSTNHCVVWQVEINFSTTATISYQLNGVSKTINWDSSAAPSFTSGKLSILSFFSPNGTTSIYGNTSILNAAP